MSQHSGNAHPESLVFEASQQLPRVVFDASTGVLSLEGKCIPENAAEFFAPLIHWIEIYLRKPRPFTNLVIRLEYFNTSTSKYLLEIARKLEKLVKMPEHKVMVTWYCEPGDLDVEEAGLDYRSILRLPFEIITMTPEGEITQHLKANKFDKEGILVEGTENNPEGAEPYFGRNLKAEALRKISIYPTPEEFELVSSISDRLQKKLNQANEKLKQQAEEIKIINENLASRNRELQLTVDELTRAKASRQATTAVLVMTLGLFILSEGVEYVIELFSRNVLNLLTVLFIKFIIALLIKPVELLLESFFLKKNHKKQMKQGLNHAV